jgi:hypothetical protein
MCFHSFRSWMANRRIACGRSASIEFSKLFACLSHTEMRLPYLVRQTRHSRANCQTCTKWSVGREFQCVAVSALAPARPCLDTAVWASQSPLQARKRELPKWLE